jgi:hypothetical protein
MSSLKIHAQTLKFDGLALDLSDMAGAALGNMPDHS